MTGGGAAITGLGAVTGYGVGAEQLWRGARDGLSAITELTEPWAAGLPVRIGGDVHGFTGQDANGNPLVAPGVARRLSRDVLWAIAAADEALVQAGASRRRAGGEAALPWNPDRVEVIVATGSGPVTPQQNAARLLDQKGPRGVPMSLAMHGAPDAAAALVSERYGITGPTQALSATCASGAVALGDALRRVRHGYADAVLVIGVEDCLGAVNLSSNANLRALAAGYESDPAAASRPFDRARSGYAMSAGACAVVVEAPQLARDRGAAAIAELAGFGAASDAYHATAPDPAGKAAARAVRAALGDAGIEAPQLGYINAHGTGTPAGDAAELVALASALGAAAHAVPLSSTKSSTGHLLGAGGVAEAIITALALERGQLPPTINLRDPEFAGWDYVVDGPRESPAEWALSNSFGFGGHNAAIVLRKPRGHHG